MKPAALLAAFSVATALSGAAHAHKPSDAYLKLEVDGARIAGQWDIALRDLEFAIGLDQNGDGEITWGELRTKHDEIAAYALARLRIAAVGGDCAARATGHLVEQHSDGGYAVLRFESLCRERPRALEIRYGLFFDFDAQHRGLLRLRAQDRTHVAAFSAERPALQFDLRRPSAYDQFVAFGREGVWHIWIGIDHVLFVVSLLLPAVLAFRAGAWRPAERFAPAFWDTFKVVTAFTVAHSITLSLAALGVISLPSRLVESAIAASVALAAMNNLYPVIRAGRWMVAFLFGLVHGFGFASVLTDLGLPQDALLLALLSFNLGVEAGQLAVVSLFLPLAFALRATAFYRRVVLAGGSAAVLAAALIWTAERALDLQLFPR